MAKIDEQLYVDTLKRNEKLLADVTRLESELVEIRAAKTKLEIEMHKILNTAPPRSI